MNHRNHDQSIDTRRLDDESTIERTTLEMRTQRHPTSHHKNDLSMAPQKFHKEELPEQTISKVGPRPHPTSFHIGDQEISTRYFQDEKSTEQTIVNAWFRLRQTRLCKILIVAMRRLLGDEETSRPKTSKLRPQLHQMRHHVLLPLSLQ
jgi:hypothetical protein